jgi:hypothetical protein
LDPSMPIKAGSNGMIASVLIQVEWLLREILNHIKELLK